MGESHFIEKNLIKYHALMPRSSYNQKLLSNILIFNANTGVHARFIQLTKKKILINIYLTPTTAVYVIPCKLWYFCKRY